jgi:hypothetical protein
MVFSNDLWREMYVDTGNTMMWIQIESSKYVDNYGFKYMKVQDVVATVGGTLQICMVIIFVVTMPFIDIHY